MQRRLFLAGTVAGLLLAAPAWATDRVARILRDLRREGFTQIDTSRTLLGRTRIVASGPAGTREIVVHPGTGEVLRDVYSGDNDDDEADDDDETEDNSGHGGGDDEGDDEGDDGDNSGHGGDGDGGDGGDGGDD